MEYFNTIAGLMALIVLEIILGIDNLVFLSILTEKLPLHQRRKARRMGLTFAWVTRLMLLASAVYIIKLKTPLFSIGEFAFSLRDIFLMLGGAFLIWKATDEIHQDVAEQTITPLKKNLPYFKLSFASVVVQVGLMDIIFSLDSVLTAVGLTDNFGIMAIAITCAILVMIFASEIVSRFISKHPTVKMLALSFLILVGMVLVADGFSFHIPRGYIYFAMAFSLSVESLNLIKQKRHKKKSDK